MSTESDYKRGDAEDAGWVFVHEGLDFEGEDVPQNATHWRAEKYESLPGRAGGFVSLSAVTEEQLVEAIATREQQFSVTDEGPVLVPAEGFNGEVDSSDEHTVERVSDAEIAAARENDDLLVLSDPSDPDSEPVGRNVRGGNELTQEDYEVTNESLAESTGDPAQDAGVAAAKDARDGADSAEDADGADAAAAAAQARHDAQDGDPGNSGNGTEVVQPAAGEATDASDSEQQSQVPDSEAAESDAERTNTDLPGDKPVKSQDEITGPDSDSVEPLRAPNAAQGEVPAGTGQPIDPKFSGDAEVTGPDKNEK